MDEKIQCPRCAGEGWIRHDFICGLCDGSGEVEEDPFFYGADLLYDQKKDNQLTEDE